MSEPIGLCLTISDKFRRDQPAKLPNDLKTAIINVLKAGGVSVPPNKQLYIERHRNLELRCDEFHFRLEEEK